MNCGRFFAGLAPMRGDDLNELRRRVAALEEARRADAVADARMAAALRLQLFHISERYGRRHDQGRSA